MISFSSHTGTHIDVPAHLINNGRTIDSYPVDSFYGTAVKVDCRNIRIITRSMIQYKIKNTAAIEFLLLFTGCDEYWGSDRYNLEFPVLEHAAADYIASLPIKGVGIDAVSFDPLNDRELFNHRALMRNGIILMRTCVI
jgi:kynurenine formamidase